jgi:uncharacterized membrane protein YfcA
MDKIGPVNVTNRFAGVLAVGGIAGLLAVIIAGTICFRYAMHGPEEVPQILGYALSTIIGFYFGTGVSRGIAAGQTEKSN